MSAQLNVQYGAGYSAPDGWLNFDASPTIRLERLPVIGRFLKINSERFPGAVLYGDIVRGLPVPDGSAKAVYASHVLEHLSYDDFFTALRNTYRVLAPGGVFRLIVPDLAGRAELYVRAVAAGDPDAASRFMDGAFLGLRSRPRGLLQTIRAALGNSAHLWMWDEPSMSKALSGAGFVNIRPCALGDAADPAFALIEHESRFLDVSGVKECAFEAVKPYK